ncbi:Acyl-homoserine-lactone synthase [Roseovarius albus]|uniref:Acyl-homoserine-lactone synthase n=1 Tax=Roseovarius albus TaxID=1247867 RepID=A0A1X6ZA78_9RHOB|nr:acyl-homoserine-lactone synthase [Roseovarius albus]SLN45845.1 Acyl-homoserine-lactone synthase [Roseovarius albus]
MILVIDALNRDTFGSILDEMYQLRARVFSDRMGWDVKITNGREIDEFDDQNPAYVVQLDEDLNVTGCARLLQTTGPHMLSDVFSDILCGEPPLRSALMWESTRFCVDHDRLDHGKGGKSIAHATCELMVGILEYARTAGIEDIVTVIDPIMNRILKRSDNAPYDYVGETVGMGKVKAMAALLECSEERIKRVRAFASITGNIFIPENELAEMMTAKVRPIMTTDLQDYFDDQFSSATNEREKAATRALQQALGDVSLH